MGDLNRFQERFIALRTALLADGQHVGVPFHSKDLPLLLERVKAEGPSFVFSTLPLLGRALDQGLVSGVIHTPANFRLKGKTRLPCLCYAVFKRIFDDEGVLLVDPCITSIRHLRQFLLFDSKLINEPSVDQKNLAWQGFCARQNLLRKKKVPVGHPVIEEARRLLRKHLRYLDLSNISPGHGPGAVSEGFDRFEKWDFKTWPAKAERVYPFLTYGTPSLRASLERGTGVKLVKAVTRCVLVPKDFRGPRLISAESTATQYLQQGQMKAIMHYIEKHPVLSRSIQLRDQTHNQRMCRNAYDAGSATLDLSDASDTVSATLVWYLLSDLPALRRQLFSTRSDEMRFNNLTQRIVAFAPMGSATCFPVETLVFWALAFASLRLVRPQYRGKRASFKSEACAIPDKVLASEIAVFGDDIIIPEDALSVLMESLISVGCKPNMSKTCWRTPFRESCGSEWYKQSDVSIIRNRRLNYDASNHISQAPVICDLQRKAFVSGLWKTADTLKQWVDSIYPVPELCIFHFTKELERLSSGFSAQDGRPIPAGNGEDGSLPDQRSIRAKLARLDFFDRTSYHIDAFVCTIGLYDAFSHRLPYRYNRNYQCKEYRIPRCFLRNRDWVEGNYARLMARLVGDQVRRIAIRGAHTRVQMAWSSYPIYNGFHRYI